MTIINTNSPLRLDGPMSDGLIEMATCGQPVVATPFTLAGAMSPVSLAGAIAQQNAEALFLVALAQIVRPGAPMVYGAFTSNVDMRTGSPAFGTPESVKSQLASGQMARRYGLPWRSSNATASNTVDAQAAYEAEMAVWGALMGGVNLLYQGAGWLEGGLTASFEKLIVDAEILQMMAEVMQPLPVDEASLGFDAIADVGPGGHFFSTAHTLERYETAFYQPLISDWRNFETWEADGARTATERANGIWKQLLAEFEPPPLEPGGRRGARRLRRAAPAPRSSGPRDVGADPATSGTAAAAPGPPFVLHFTTTAQASADAHALARPGLSRFDLIVDAIGLLLAAVLLVAGNVLLGLLVGVVAVVSLLGRRSHPLQRALIAVRFRSILGRATTVTIDDDGIRSENELGTSFLRWSSVDTVHSTRRTVAFFRGPVLLSYVPSSAFGSPEAQGAVAAFAVTRIDARG